MVLAVIGILVAAAITAYAAAVDRAEEKVLRDNLRIMRSAIDAYARDRNDYPSNLRELVRSGYLDRVPTDPVAATDDGWVEELGTTASGGRGVFDIHSRSEERGSNGIPYSQW